MQTDALLKNAHVRVWHLSSYYQPELEAKFLSNQGIDRDAQGEHAGVGDMAQIMVLSPDYVRPIQKTTAMPKNLGFSGKPELASPVLGRALLKLRINEAIKQIKGFQ